MKTNLKVMDLKINQNKKMNKIQWRDHWTISYLLNNYKMNWTNCKDNHKRKNISFLLKNVIQARALKSAPAKKKRLSLNPTKFPLLVSQNSKTKKTNKLLKYKME